jgi:hypothetical protein
VKRKEIIQLGVAVVVLCASAILIYSQIAPKKASDKPKYTYEDVQPIEPNYDSVVMTKITDTNQVKDFYVAPDLKSGIGNTTPFKPIN